MPVNDSNMRCVVSHQHINKRFCRVFLIWLSLLPCMGLKSESITNSMPPVALANAPRTFGSSASVGGQLQADDQIDSPALSPTFIDQYEAWLQRQRSGLRDHVGLTLAGDYNALVQGATESLGEDWAAGGVFRVYGQWRWPGEPWKNPGSLTFKFENRHRYTEISPQKFGAQLGYSSLTAITWSDAGWLLSNFYWHQQFLDNRLSFVAGIVDVTDYVDTYGLVNPWTDFMNSTLSCNPTIAAPGQGPGVAVRGSLTERIYLAAGLADASGDPTQPLDSIEGFFTEAEYFKHIELGWSGSWDRRMEDNIHVTAWQTSERTKAGIPSGWGVAASANWLFAERWLPFVRAGWSDGGGGVPLETAVSAGAGYYLRDRSDLLAIGFTWGRPSTETYDSGLRDEYTLEMMYRVQLLQRLSLTPDIQVLVNPALNPDQDVIAVFGLRARLTL
ncbi:MAG: carbohydrate porin [Verrucomicrobiales bacterium]|nr:carbohydrate porin [Planctomycetota bacterium]MCP5523597.1 carbohydrate porin [Verrucomicrobiales bacterium]